MGPSTVYICGSCGKDVKVDKDSGIKCLHCGHRIFYKKRDRKLLQYDARWIVKYKQCIDQTQV